MTLCPSKYLRLLLTSSALAAALLLGACSKNGANASGGDLSAAQETIQGAFKEAKPEVKGLADEAAASMQRQEPAKAFVQLNGLTASPDLTPEQRAAASQSMLAVSQRLREAAQKGDEEAGKLLDMYRSSK